MLEFHCFCLINFIVYVAESVVLIKVMQADFRVMMLYSKWI